MGLLNKNIKQSQQQNSIQTPRAMALQKYNTSRVNMLCMIAFTVLNIILFFSGSDRVLLFSASMPYIALTFGMINTVKYMVPALIFAVVILALYFVFLLLSKKNYTWLIVALILFILDSVCMIWFYLEFSDISSGVFDIVFHAWIIYYFIIGIINGKKLKDMSANGQSHVATLNSEVLGKD